MRGATLVPSNRLDILWLDENFAMNYTIWNDIDNAWPQDGKGVSLNLGGVFVTPPTAVSVGENHLHVFGLGADYALYHIIYDVVGTHGIHWSDWENLSGNFASTPTAISTAPNRIDLFGLGPDQGMLHTAWNGSAWRDWKELGGCFTGTPVITPRNSSQLDIFARGLDFHLYHMSWSTNAASDWAPLGGGLLGEPTAASAPAAVTLDDKIFVFVTGKNGAIWYIAFDGKQWKPWKSLGPAQAKTPKQDLIRFVSEPSAVSIAPSSNIVAPVGSITSGAPDYSVISQPPSLIQGRNRIDVFGVGSDGALRHKWLDAAGWHGENGAWERVESSFACAPSIVAQHGGGRIFSATVDIYMVEPHQDGTIHLLSLDGTTWRHWDLGPRFRLPSCYTFSVDAVDIQHTRARTDTDLATATIAVGKWTPQSASYDMNDVNAGGYALYNLKFESTAVELCEPVMFSYSIVNSDKSSDLAKFIVGAMLKATEDVFSDWLKSVVNPPTTTTAVGELLADVLVDAGGGPAVLASLGAALVAEAIDYAIGIAFGGCDGIVATNAIPFQKGHDILAAIQHSARHKISGATPYPGTDSHDFCGGNSLYTVYWSISLA